MKNKRNLAKITKRNTHKRRSKEAARRELLKAINEVGISAEGVKIGFSNDRGPRGTYYGDRSEDILTRGVYSGSKVGYGFVRTEESDRDIFIPADKTRGAVDGDLVEIIYHNYINREGEGKTEGRVTKILEAARKTIIGSLSEEIIRHGRRAFRRYCVKPDDPHISLTPYITDRGGAEVGDKVEVLIRRDGTREPYGDILRIFGADDSREANYSAILAECSIPTEFSDEELSLAERLAAEPISTEGRADLRREIIFTIDGEGAKDLDDAISLRLLPGGGFRLGVHIADVSHYVAERTALDRCAMSRGTSVYFTDKVVPMLPPALSNGACSLNSGEDKYTLSAIIDIDGEGNILKTELKKSIINSRVRGVYSEVNAILSGEATAEIKKKYSSVKPTLEKMRKLYEILLKKSSDRGAIDFDADEAVILIGEDGAPSDIIRRERGVSERIIEQFMLTANEAVATYLTNRGIPCVYRVHETPPPEGYAGFIDYLESLGFDVRKLRKTEPTPKILSEILEIAEEKGLSDAVSYTMLRAMAKAKYSEVRQPHFGLGIENYCHFTSPIRRLSDLATHRIINRVVFEGKRAENYSSYARRAAAAATEGELRALSAERRIEDLYKTIYMSEHIGEEFDATISSITGFGMFVTLENTCEGLIPISELVGVYTFDERNLTLRSRYKTYHIAERISVRLEEANISRGKLRFSVVE